MRRKLTYVVCVYVQDACAEKSLITRHGLVYHVQRRGHERDREIC